VTTPARQVTFGAGYSFGNAVNFFPATGVTAPCSQPCLARSDAGDAELTLRPVAAQRFPHGTLRPGVSARPCDHWAYISDLRLPRGVIYLDEDDCPQFALLCSCILLEWPSPLPQIGDTYWPK